MPDQLPPDSPAPEKPAEKPAHPKHEEKVGKNFWQRMSTDAKVLSVIGIFALLAARLVIPEVRTFLGLKAPAEQTAQPAPAPVQTPHEEPQPPKESNPEETRPVTPHLRYVPLPNAAPLRTPKTLVTSIPKEGTEAETVSINGEKIPVMTQKDLEEVLAHKTNSGFVFASSSPSENVDLFVTIRKDGTVQNVQAFSGSKYAREEATEAIKQWRFKPFIKDGEQVAVQTVIQFKAKAPEKQEQ